MRQNEKDFQELNHHLKNLEHRYALLSEEKVYLFPFLINKEGLKKIQN